MNPVGKTLRYGPNSPPVQVIGLVKDGKYVSLTEASDPVVFRPILQDYNPTTTLVVRSRDSAAALVPQIRKEIMALDPRLPIYGTGSLESMLGFAMFPMHAAAIALSAFGVLALLITITGIYGLVDYSVARRTRELGIRIAVGARGIEVLRLLLGKLIFVVSVGLGLGVLFAFALGPALSAIIYTTSPRDPLLILEVFIALLGAALLSSYRPVVRGLSVNPVDALRSE